MALQTETAPPMLKNFFPELLEELRSINESEGRNYPAPPIPSILNNPAFLPSLAQQLNFGGYSQQPYQEESNYVPRQYSNFHMNPIDF